MPIDIPAEDFESIANFYQGIFGWTFEEEQSGEGHSLQWGDKNLLCAAGSIQQLGGVVSAPKAAVPGNGLSACCPDPEENYFLIWEYYDKAG